MQQTKLSQERDVSQRDQLHHHPIIVRLNNTRYLYDTHENGT
jgi:hypothetical protein